MSQRKEDVVSSMAQHIGGQETKEDRKIKRRSWVRKGGSKVMGVEIEKQEKCGRNATKYASEKLQ